MLWLYILLGIALFVALVMFIPITLRASYKEEFWCAVYIGFVKLQLVPAKPKKEKKKKVKKQTPKTKQPKKATEKKPSLIKIRQILCRCLSGSRHNCPCCKMQRLRS